MDKGPAILDGITVFVCRTCDRDPARMETLAAEGGGFGEVVRKLLKGMTNVRVRTVKCLGGCECYGDGTTVNGCCSVGLAGEGRFSYVLNRFDPAADGWKVPEFLRLYRKRPNGRIVCGESERADELRPHVAARVPPHKG
jgi:predicted metal-binding protein